MNIRLIQLRVITRQTTEIITFAPGVTFIHGPVGTGKSTTARLIDFCLGGRLERTPAVQREYVAAQLTAQLGDYAVQFERAASDSSCVRVTWERLAGEVGSVNAPLDAGEAPILGETVYNLSDLIFFLAGVEPIRVRKSKRDPDSPLVRLSFRDVLWYCYLKQERLDSSFFRLEDTFKRLKSMDVMRFITGLHSDRLNELEAALAGAQDEQRAKRAAVEQIRRFLDRFQLGSELATQIQTTEQELAEATATREGLERDQKASTHVVEPMRVGLRQLSAEIEKERVALIDVRERVEDQRSLRSELIAAKMKASRVDAASSVLTGVEFDQCPRCGAPISQERQQEACYLCGAVGQTIARQPAVDIEALRRDLNSRIDDLAESISRHEREVGRQERKVQSLLAHKARLDAELSAELARYDSAFVANVRAADRAVATLQERIALLRQLARMPAAIQDLEREAGGLQGEIDVLRSSLAKERERLHGADAQIRYIQNKFLTIMREVGFPGVDERDRVTLDPRNWMPNVVHGEDADIVWSFFDAGSGGKKTLFNVCYALALHEVAVEQGLPLPSLLIIDSPTKNISRDINAQLVASLYHYIYGLAERSRQKQPIQFILIDSDLVPPEHIEFGYMDRLMMHNDSAHPPLISYYVGP